jgi:hypothetical protein
MHDELKTTKCTIQKYAMKTKLYIFKNNLISTDTTCQYGSGTIVLPIFIFSQRTNVICNISAFCSSGSSATIMQVDNYNLNNIL